MKFCKRIIIIISIVLLSGILFFPTSTAENLEYSLNHDEVKQGDVLVIALNSNSTVKKAHFLESKYKIRKINGKPTVLIPISYWNNPGKYELILEGRDKTTKKTIKITDGDFAESHIEVDENQEEKVRPEREETKKRKEEDQKLTEEALADSAEEKLWDNPFITPVKGTVTTDFGAERYVNGELQSRHSGIDIAAPEGDEVKATAAGRVTLARELLVTGNTVLIDHGLDIFSSYAHLKNIKVEKGQTVEQGDMIGTVGSTGFSTGPHVHWSVRLKGIFVNPDQFTTENLLK
ncbi:MAG: M23 family metallopeptidase [Halanaerobiaceae bacterium]